MLREALADFCEAVELSLLTVAALAILWTVCHAKVELADLNQQLETAAAEDLNF